MDKKKESKSVFINTKLATVLAKEDSESLFDGTFHVNNASKKSDEENAAKMMCSVELEQNDITLSREINAYDRAIQDAVCTLMTNGYKVFSSEQLARAFVGSEDSTRGISKTRMKRLNETMEKLANIRASIIYSNNKGQQVEVKNYLIPMASYRKVKSGSYIYEMLDWPAVYTFAKAKRQLITIPMSVMNAEIDVKDTDDTVIIKRYLIRRIEIMKNDSNHVANNCISYSSIFTELGLTDRVANIAKKKVVIRNTVNSLMSYFKKIEYIDDWKEYRKEKSKQVNGVRVKLKEEQGNEEGTEK